MKWLASKMQARSFYVTNIEQSRPAKELNSRDFSEHSLLVYGLFLAVSDICLSLKSNFFFLCLLVWSIQNDTWCFASSHILTHTNHLLLFLVCLVACMFIAMLQKLKPLVIAVIGDQREWQNTWLQLHNHGVGVGFIWFWIVS